jgi:hypothetical protein
MEAYVSLCGPLILSNIFFHVSSFNFISLYSLTRTEPIGELSSTQALLALGHVFSLLQLSKVYEI